MSGTGSPAPSGPPARRITGKTAIAPPGTRLARPPHRPSGAQPLGALLRATEPDS